MIEISNSFEVFVWVLPKYETRILCNIALKIKIVIFFNFRANIDAKQRKYCGHISEIFKLYSNNIKNNTVLK